MGQTLVIAEPGCTHEGDWSTLLDLLHTAKRCGADVWKPQWTSDPVQMCERRHIGPDHPKRTYYERAYSWLNFPVAWHAEFKALCQQVGLQYAVTCFLPQDVATVAPFVDYFKIANFESQDEALIEACKRFQGYPNPGGGPVLIVSHPGGVPNPAYRCWWARPKHLHCVAAYPAPMEAMNLSCIREVHDEYGDCVRYGFDGLSDHSRHLLTGALAVACGADIIETHYRLDSCDPNNPDYAVAFTPAEFTTYIQNIRDAEIMLGDGVKQIQPCEEWALPYRVTA